MLLRRLSCSMYSVRVGAIGIWQELLATNCWTNHCLNVNVSINMKSYDNMWLPRMRHVVGCASSYVRNGNVKMICIQLLSVNISQNVRPVLKHTQ